jgi:glycosyltransferase involved in cell wall biosynthesis
MYWVSQQDQPHTHVIADDGSPDEISSLIENITASLPNVRYLRQQHGGQSYAVNEAVNAVMNEVNADYLTITHSDDVLLPGSLSARVRVAEETGSPFVYSQMGMFFGESPLFSAYTAPVFKTPAALRRALLHSQPFPYPTMLWEKEFYAREIGGYDSALHHAEDWDVAIRTAQALEKEQMNAAVVPSVTALYRVHETNLTKHNIANGVDLAATRAILSKHATGVDRLLSYASVGLYHLRTRLPLPVRRLVNFFREGPAYHAQHPVHTIDYEACFKCASASHSAMNHSKSRIEAHPVRASQSIEAFS